MSLTKDEVAECLGVKETLIRQWTRDGTIPRTFYHQPDGHAFAYAPVTVALGELMLELGAFFGSHSTLPKLIVKQAVPALERAWQATDGLPAYLRVQHGGLEVHGELGCLARARNKLAAFAA